MQEREFRGAYWLAAKSAAYAFVTVVAIYLLFRVVAPLMWGLHTDFAPFLSIGSVLGGAFGVAAMGFAMIRDLMRHNAALEDRRERDQ